MSDFKKRVVTYITVKYKQQLAEICEDREESEAFIVREIIKEYFELKDKYKRKTFPKNNY